MCIIKGFATNKWKYFEYELIGEWVEFPCDEDKWNEVLERIGINEEYNDYFFTDWEIDLNNEFTLDSDITFEEINKLAEELELLDDYELEKLDAILETVTSDIREALDDLNSYEFISDTTLVEYAEQLINDCYVFRDTPEILVRYFDYEAFARDLEFDGYYEANGGVLWYC